MQWIAVQVRHLTAQSGAFPFDSPLRNYRTYRNRQERECHGNVWLLLSQNNHAPPSTAVLLLSAVACCCLLLPATVMRCHTMHGIRIPEPAGIFVPNREAVKAKSAKTFRAEQRRQARLHKTTVCV